MAFAGAWGEGEEKEKEKEEQDSPKGSSNFHDFLSLLVSHQEDSVIAS